MTSDNHNIDFRKERDKELAEEQIFIEQASVDYDTKELTVELLVNKFQPLPKEPQNQEMESDIYIPAYQRGFVWDKETQSKFIESVILGFPTPFMFMAETRDGRLEIIDGAQRIQTLSRFIHNELNLSGLHKLTRLNGFTFKDLPISQQRRFKNRTIKITVLSYKADPTTIIDIFERINTGGQALTHIEVMKGIYDGLFFNFIEKCAENKKFNELCSVSDAGKRRKEPEELILRFFAYSEQYHSLNHPIHEFIENYLKDKNKGFNQEEMKQNFIKVLDFVEKYFPNGFKKNKASRTVSRVRFEAIAVGSHLAIQENPNLIPESMDWVESKEFQEHLTTSANNSPNKLKGRIEFVRDSLLNKK